MLKYRYFLFFLFIVSLLFSKDIENIDSTLLKIDTKFISELKKENLSIDHKIYKELEYLNSGNQSIEKYEINELKLDKFLQIDFHLGILFPISSHIKKHSDIGYNVSTNLSIPIVFKILNHDIQNSIYLNYSTFGNSFNITSAVFKNTVSYKNIPLFLSIGSGISNGGGNYFTNTFDVSYKFPNENFNLFINLNFQSSWNNFNLINNIAGFNIEYSRYYKF